MRFSSSGQHHEFLLQTRQLPVTVRRGHAIDDTWGWCDLPIRLSERGVKIGGTINRPVIGYESTATPYELQVMMVWGSWKAMVGMNAEEWVGELGVRVAVSLALENP